MSSITMKWIILMIFTITVADGRPQNDPHNSEPSVEFEKQKIIEVTESSKESPGNPTIPIKRKVEANTQEILDKIAEVNKKQGLTPRKQKPNYFHFPFSYSRSQENERVASERQSTNFKFTTDPLRNPIFEYLERENLSNDDLPFDVNINHKAIQPSKFENQEPLESKANADITADDIVPGQFIKRKIVHQQTFLIPSQNLLPPPNPMMLQNIPPSVMQSPLSMQQGFPDQSHMLNIPSKDITNNEGDKKTLSHLEKQTVDNVRNIVSNTQLMQSQNLPFYYNPYLHYQMSDNYQYGFAPPNKDLLDQQNAMNEYNYRLYGPYALPNSDKGRQNWNWPGANYFPIYIRDPFLQMYNAITSMIEYGPNAGQAGPCKIPTRNKIKPLSRDEEVPIERKLSKKLNEKETIKLELDDNSFAPQITIYGADDELSNKNSESYLDIENLDIGTNKEDLLKFTVSLKAQEKRESKDAGQEMGLKLSLDKIKKNYAKSNSTRTAGKLEKFSENAKDIKSSATTKSQLKPELIMQRKPILSPPVRDPNDKIQGIDDQIDEDDKDVTISNDGNKKLFSRDNTGSGIFIHKLKVRKGGVAIAGPGGIATAGSGGTAIVGPNGVAYTQPDSLAIAGSGTKVVAVDPTINLGDLISNTRYNKTSLESFPPSRVGKVVAVGPVIYYNKG